MSLNCNAFNNLTTIQLDTFTNIPTSATQLISDVSTNVATTAFCKNIIAGMTSLRFLNNTSTQTIPSDCTLTTFNTPSVSTTGALSLGISTVTGSVSLVNTTGSLTLGGTLQAFNSTFRQSLSTSQINKQHIQRGSAVAVPGTALIISFPTAYTSSVPLVYVSASGGGGLYAYVTSTSLSSFTVNGTATTIYWTALGN